VSDWTVESPDRVVHAKTFPTGVVYERVAGAWVGHVTGRDGSTIAGPHQLDAGDFTDQYVIGMLDRLTGRVAS